MFLIKVLVTLTGLALLGVALVTYGNARWARQTSVLVRQLNEAEATHTVAVYDESEIKGLPAPVQRYFKLSLTDGQKIVAGAQVTHTGSFNMDTEQDSWKPFTSKQRVATNRPGFVWDGTIAAVPGIPVHVHDAYVAGSGLLHPSIAGIYSLTRLEGGGDIAAGELMRFFAEACWYPTALLPSQGVKWEAIDDSRAKATMHDGEISATLIFGFGKDGLIETVFAEARGRTVGGKIVPTPWQGKFWDYTVRNGMRFPLKGEVAWVLPSGPKPYWRGEITDIEYRFTR